MKRRYKYTQTVITTSGGAATVYFGPSGLNARVVAVEYVFGDLANTLDLTMTGDKTGVPILTYANVPAADAWWYPRALPALNTAGGTPGVDAFVDIYVVNERIKLVVAQGGNTKTGTVTVITEEDSYG